MCEVAQGFSVLPIQPIEYLGGFGVRFTAEADAAVAASGDVQAAPRAGLLAFLLVRWRGFPLPQRVQPPAGFPYRLRTGLPSQVHQDPLIRFPLLDGNPRWASLKDRGNRVDVLGHIYLSANFRLMFDTLG